MLELFKIFGTLEMKGADKANQELDGVDKKAKGLGSKMGNAAKKIGKAGAVVGGAMAGIGTAAFAMTEKVTGAFDDISKGAQRLGVSTDFYQEMDFWASQNGLSHERMEKAIGRFNQRLGQATNGNERYSTALQDLGVNLDDVKNGSLSTEDAFAQSIQTLSEMESQQDQVNLATELFGTRMARDMLPALQNGALSIEDARKKAQELGIVIGEDSLSAGVKFQDTWDQMKRSLTTFGQQVFSQLIPVFQTMLDWIIANMPTIQGIFSTVFGVVQTVFGTLVSWIQTTVTWLQAFFTTNQETVTGIWTAIQEYFTLIKDFWMGIWNEIKAFWTENGQAILNNAMTVFNSIWETVKVAFDFIKTIIQQVLSYVVPFIQTQLARIQQFWDQNGQQIMQAVQNAFTIIQNIIQTVMPIVQNIISNAWNIIQSVFNAAVGIIMGIIKTLASLLTGDFEGIKEGLTQIWESLWDGIKGIVGGAWDLLSGAFSNLWDSVKGWFGDLKDKAKDWGKNFIDGFISGIKDMGQKVANAAEDVVKKAGEFLKFWSPAKKGEGRYITHWGRNMVDGFLDGVRDEEDSAGVAMQNVIKRMNPGRLNMNTTVSPSDVGNVSMTPTRQNEIQQSSTEVLLQQILAALQDGKNIFLDGEILNKNNNERNALETVGRFF
ncbi:phage tail protein [Virgibacillus salexigens]|uniref:phage tail protein n=1 Tax=Virgibacillus salexigens TaxID=61016 RepID=UPI00190A1722|nr:hypothetical protein [Virgibacillus salexigens]